jgi:hypothetical protein
MNRTLEMLLEWTRKDREFRLIAWGFYLATNELDAVDRMYFENIHNARMQGISA